MTAVGAPPRSCGSCSLCCKVMSIPELEKPAGSWCPNVRLGSSCGGCAIYETRPESCRSFACAWLDGFLPENLKPDRSKAVVTASNAGWLVVHVDPKYPDAATSGALGRWLAETSLLAPVLIVCGARRRLIANGPRASSQARQILAAAGIDLPIQPR